MMTPLSTGQSSASKMKQSHSSHFSATADANVNVKKVSPVFSRKIFSTMHHCPLLTDYLTS